MITLLAPLGAAAIAGVALRRAIMRRMERECLRGNALGDDGVIRGAEPFTIPRPGAPAVLLIHGGADTPQTLRYLGNYLANAGFAVRAPLLPGHGRTLAAFRGVSADAWIACVRAELDALRRDHGRVAVVGLSMGGALAARLAAERRDLPALVLLAPYLTMPERTARIAGAARLWGALFPYVRTAQPGRAIRDPDEASRTLGYGAFAAEALRALRDTVDAARAALPAVRAPTLVVHSREDYRITNADAEAAFRRLGAAEKRLEWVEGAGHVITVDYGRERVFALTAEWLDAHLVSRAAQHWAAS